jgi:hypothetical protein
VIHKLLIVQYPPRHEKELSFHKAFHKHQWEIWDFHGGKDSSSGLMGCDTMKSCGRMPAVWKTLLPWCSPFMASQARPQLQKFKYLLIQNFSLWEYVPFLCNISVEYRFVHFYIYLCRTTIARFRCVFGSRDSPLNARRTLRIWLCAYLPHLKYIKPSSILPYPEVEFCNVWVSLCDVRLGWVRLEVPSVRYTVLSDIEFCKVWVSIG